jgi:zinc transport system substrate-binding protein
MRRAALLGTACLLSLVVGGAAAHDAPRVITSIGPLGGIAAAVMDGVGTPSVLLEPGSSPHAYSLRPSQAQALSEADLIVWVGPDMEAFLERPLAALGRAAHKLELATLEGVELLPYREGALFDAHDHGHGHGHGHDDHAHDHSHDHDHDDHAHDDDHNDDHDHAHDDDHDHDDDDHAHDHDHDHDDHAHDHGHHGHAHGEMDGHLWLSPANARVIAGAIAAALGEIDAAHAETYAANAAGFALALDAVEAEIDAQLAPVRGRPFIVFHDAYHYFEQHFDITAAGAIHLSPEVQPGAARVAEIQERIASLDAVCVFAEPQFEPRIIGTVTEGSTARSGVLDPLGVAVTIGPDAYPALLRDLATSLADCLGD